MKPYLRLCLLALPLQSAITVATGAEPPTKHPEEPQTQSTHNHRGPKQLMLENAEGAVITLWKPDLTTQPLKPAHGAITIPKTGMNNYHAVVVEKDWGNSKEALIRYEYMFGRPSKQSPSKLADAVKTDLEIVPAPIPREHFRYLSDQPWGFQVRLHGQPLANLPLALETEHGSRLETVTDSRGYANFLIPDDFPDTIPGKRDERRAEFAVSATTEAGGIAYETMLTASYRINPAHWQSSPMGWAVVGLGVIAGSLLGRHRGCTGAAS
ncbi:MAG: hypothetical protein PVI92_07880 [Chromatiales bacterium]|jgi:hypothetical protein